MPKNRIGQLRRSNLVGTWGPGAPMKTLAYYRDDSTADPPENEPGLMMYGFRFENLLDAKGESYPFNLINFVVPNYDGNFDSIAGLAERPLEFSVR